MGQLRENGVAILYISHRLEEILKIADRITVLRDGESIACRAAKDVDRSELIQLIVGRSISSVLLKLPVRIGDVAIEVRDLQHPFGGERRVSFSVRRGEIFLLAGLVDAGRTEIAGSLFGLTPLASVIHMGGRACQIRSPQEAIRLGIEYLPEDRRQHGLILEMAIAKTSV